MPRPSLLLAVLGTSALLVTGCGVRNRQPFSPSLAPAPSALAATPPTSTLTLQLDLPGIGPSYAPTVSFHTPGRRARITGRIAPAGAGVLIEPQGNVGHGFSTLPARVSGTRFAATVDVAPGANTFNVVGLKPGAQTQVAQAVITSDRQASGIDPALLAATAAADQTNAPVTISPHAKKGIGQSAGSVSLANPTINRINAPPPPASGGPGTWVAGFEVTEYYPVPESLFSGPLVVAPGLSTPHRQDWLYGPRGVVLEGDGIGLDGSFYHVVNVQPPYSFAPGPSRPLSYYRSLAVDPRVIPFGSHVYIPAYRSINGGWFEADDTGGAIIGDHVDVYRPPPRSLADTGSLLRGQPVYIVRP